MAKYFFSNKAVEDLTKIWEYTFEVWSENQADKYYEQIIESCQFIAEKPTKGKKYLEISDEILGFKVERHIIFYRQVSQNEIEIIRILHERMDLKNRIYD